MASSDQTSTDAQTIQPRGVDDAAERWTNHLRGMLIAIGECAYELDAQMRFTYASEAAETVFGLSPDALIGRSLVEFSPVPNTPEDLVAAAASDTAPGWRTEEVLIRRADGSEGRVRSTWMPIRNADGVVTGYVGAARDFTEDYRARDELAASQRRFDEVAEASGECVFEFGTDFRFTYLSRAAHEVLRAPAHELVGRSLFDFALPCTPEEHEQRVAMLKRPGIWRAPQHQMLRADGSVAWIRTTVRSIAGPDGQWAGCRGVISDISDHVRTVQDLDRQTRRLSDIAEVASDFLFEVDADWRFVWVSAAVEAVTGLGVEAFLGRTPSEVFGYDGPINSAEHWRTLMEQHGGVIRNAELAGESGGPHEGWWTISLIALRDEAGRIVGARGSMTDITARKRETEELVKARNAAEAANTAKAEFLASISHEIRTPLHAVIAASELLKDTELSVEQTRLAGIAQTAGMHLATVLDDVLDYSKIDAGKLSLEAAPFDARAELAGVADMLAERARAKGLAMTFEAVPDNAMWVIGDAARLRQIAVNYIGNAIKFTLEGSIHIRLEQSATGLRLEVSDTGIGVPEGREASLFDPFTQADTSTTRLYGGTGLGLAIVRRLAELMGGSVGMESRQGEGSTFWFEAPLPAGAPAGAAPRFADPGVRTAHILVAEDNEANRLLIRLVLAKLGHSCDLAADGAEAVRLAARGDHDLVILDRRMPGMDGEEAARRIRALGGRLSTVPMIGLTADATSEARASFAAAGVPTVLAKPLVIARLAAAIDAALDASPTGGARLSA